MKQSVLLLLARLAAALSLFGIFLSMHLTFTLGYFLPASQADSVMNIMYIFYFTGIVLGVVLCPLFLPVPNGKTKPLAMGLGFIALLTLIECIFRFQGIAVWLNSAAVRCIMAIPEGILTTMSFGLFYLAWQKKPVNTDNPHDQTCKGCLLIFGIALLGSVLARCYSVPALENSIAAADPFKGVVFTFNCIKWAMLCMGVFAAATVFLLKKIDSPLPASESTPQVATDWQVILRLAGLAAVFTILNGALNMRFLPLYSTEAIYHPNFLIVAAAVLVLVFLAGRSINRFFNWFLPTGIVLFILISCLPLFEEHRQVEVFMSTLVAIAHYTIWVVFTATVVERYHGSFWFYGMAALIFSSVAFAFLAPLISRYVPDSTQYRVLFIVIAAVSFMLLAFRLLFPKHPGQEPFPANANPENIFKERKLSQREIEVANYLLKHALGKKEIAEQLHIASGTAKVHISNVYKKFGVRTRAEFMALFVNKN